jgi:hypothetical protein
MIHLLFSERKLRRDFKSLAKFNKFMILLGLALIFFSFIILNNMLMWVGLILFFFAAMEFNS